jgi:flagellar biosynthesis protein FlhB
MAPFDDSDDKTEAPTPRRREESRERGQVVRSTDLSAAAGLLGAMLALNYFGPKMLNDMLNLTQDMLSYSASNVCLPSSMTDLGFMALTALAKLTVPVCLALMVVALIVSLAQVGFLFTFHPITPDLQKLDPIAGLFRILSMESLFKLVLSLFKVGLIGAVSYYTIKNRMGQIMNITDLDYIQIGSIACSLIFMLGIRLSLILFILAIFDYAYTWYKTEKQMRMSKQELKEELRRMEGDPLLKERRRRVARQLAMQRMQMAVPKADVIVTNPTELAIALKYDSQTMTAPRVVAKGAGFVAARIRQIAMQHRIPIIERKPLAQALYKTVEVGKEIPPSFYKAVAEILAYVYELTGKIKVPARNNTTRPQTAGMKR